MSASSKISALVRSVGRPTAYKPEFCHRIVELMAEGRSLDGCASILGVNPDSLYVWQNKYPAFSEAVRIGRAASTTFWETRLLEVAKGGAGHAGAIMWGLRNRSKAIHGWDHANGRVEVTGRDGGAVQLQTAVVTIDARLLSAEQRQSLRQTLLAAREQVNAAGKES
jgi:transposase